MEGLIYLFDGVEVLDVLVSRSFRHGAVGVGVEIPRDAYGYPDKALLYATSLAFAPDVFDFDQCAGEAYWWPAFEIVELAFFEVRHPDLGDGGQ